MSIDRNLDFYRRRAKELLKLARSGSREASERFARHHPDFSDSNAPQDNIALNQAQLVIAREQGFSSWPRFKAYIDSLERSGNQSPEDRLQEIIRAKEVDSLAAFFGQEPRAASFRVEPLGVTPLHIAASVNWVEGAEFLLAAGADVNALSENLGMTPLRMAIGYGASEVALFLLESGADPNLSDSDQKTNVQTAAYAGNAAMIRALIDHGATVDIFGAIALSNEELVREICARDPDSLKQRMCSHQSVTIFPLHLAAYLNSTSMIDLLIDLGADHAAEDEQGRRAIDLALQAGNRQAYERLSALGSAANPELIALVGSADRAERIARLHQALVDNDLSSAEAELDADPSLISQHFPDVWGTGGTFGATALHWAAMFGHIEMARMLLERGASLTARDLTYDATPLGWAAEYRRREMVAFLEANGPRL